MRRICITKEKLLLYFIFFFLLVNLFRDINPGGTNQIIGGAIVVTLFINLMPLKKNEFLYFAYYFMSALGACLSTDDLGTHLKYTLYFILNISVFFLIIREKNNKKIYKSIIQEKKLMRSVVTVFTMLILCMLLLNECYSTDLWNGGRFFQGFSVPHGVAGSCSLAIIILIILISIDQKLKYCYLLDIFIMIIAIVKAGTRTYLISAAAMLLLASFSLVKKKSTRNLLIVLGLIMFTALVVSSESFQNKIQYSMSFQNLLGWSFLDAFTSSRTIIWSNDLEMFFSRSSLVQIFFGGGFSYSYEINATWTYRIQAHNGFIEVLMSTGVVGFLLYIKALNATVKSLSMKNKWYCLIIVLYILLVIFWDDILQAPSYMMSFIFVYSEIMVLESMKFKEQCIAKK